MKTMVILSGKGGTGKTTLTSSFAVLASKESKLIMADLDVDAANLELLIQPTIEETHPFYSGETAAIDQDLCINCGLCFDVCRFDAVKRHLDLFTIDADLCEGCLSCFYQCPVSAIKTIERYSGDWFQSSTPYGKLFHARLKPGAESSGKLVSQVRSSAEYSCNDEECDILLMDGPPGTGCPVTASIKGADLALIISEPTKSGLHDLERIYQVAAHFQVPAYLVLNKSDLNQQVRREILHFARKNQIVLLGEVPYDERVFALQADGKPLVEIEESAATDAIRLIWQRVKVEAGIE